MQVNALGFAGLGVGCVGDGPTLDEAGNAGEELVANESCRRGEYGAQKFE